jgi:hypothetical protein
MNSCDYIFKTGKRRPCPPGKDCTVRITKRQLHKVEIPRVLGTIRSCEWCGTEFVVNNVAQRFCCYRCKDASYRYKHRKHTKEKTK